MEIDNIDDRPVQQRVTIPSGSMIGAAASPLTASGRPVQASPFAGMQIQKPTGPIGYIQHTTPVPAVVTPAVTKPVDSSGSPVTSNQPPSWFTDLMKSVPDAGTMAGSVYNPNSKPEVKIIAQPTQEIPVINPSPDNAIQQFLSGFKGLFQPSSASQQAATQSQGSSGGGISINLPASQSGAASVSDLAPQLISANPKLYGLIAIAVIAVVLYLVFKK